MNDPVNLIDPTGKLSVGIGDFIDDVSDAVDNMEGWSDYLEGIRKWALCQINPSQCGEDPAEEPFKNDDFTDEPKGCSS